jgi:hypothetical protein
MKKEELKGIDEAILILGIHSFELTPEEKTQEAKNRPLLHFLEKR